MDGNNNKYPQYPYSFPPPTWVDPYQSSSSSSLSVPKWVIAAIVLAVVILVFFLFWYIRKREKKIMKKAAEAAAAKAPRPPPRKDKPAGTAKPTPKERISVPNTCNSCRHEGGIYKFTYRCPWCRYEYKTNFSDPSP